MFVHCYWLFLRFLFCFEIPNVENQTSIYLFLPIISCNIYNIVKFFFFCFFFSFFNFSAMCYVCYCYCLCQIYVWLLW